MSNLPESDEPHAAPAEPAPSRPDDAAGPDAPGADATDAAPETAPSSDEPSRTEPAMSGSPATASGSDPEAAGPVAETTAVPGADDPHEHALRLAEAVVFASAAPVSPRVLSGLLPTDTDPDAVLAALRERYAGRGVELVEAGGGFQFRTALDLAPALRKVIEAPRRLPRVAMETLAIIAYHQPVTRPEIEEIRGASLSQQTIDALLEANLVTPKGRRESPGRPTLWGTTPQFLTQFGLKDLRDLPRRDDLLVEPVQPASHTDQPPSDAPAGAPEGEAAASPEHHARP
jgi:segregation and condensation protein B